MTDRPTDVDLAFGNIKWLPPWDAETKAIDKEGLRNPYYKFVATWFYDGINLKEWDCPLKDGVTLEETRLVTRQVQAILASFAPKHEHKMAGCALMLSRVFQPPTKKETP